MEAAASAVAFAQAAQVCIKIAHTVIEKVRAYRHANDLIAELVIRIERIWTKTETQLVALSNVRDYQNERLREFHEECVRRLIAKLYAANGEIGTFTDSKLDGLSLLNLTVNTRRGRKLQFSLVERRLRKTVTDLESWHAIFDPSWFLLTLRNDESMDATLRRQSSNGPNQEDLAVILTVRTAIQEAKHEAQIKGSIFYYQGYVRSERKPLPFSSLAISELSSDGTKVIIDTTAYPEETDKGRISTHVRTLARILACSQPWTLGFLQCKGVLKQFDQMGRISQFQYIFSMPPEQYIEPSSLRALLLGPVLSLDIKYSIAKSVTRGVLAVHSADFVHKNIRPDNILVFNSPQEHDTKAFLVGFELSRPTHAHTSLTGDMKWERNLYRHPNRQGIKPEDVYLMQHDIYSLGVCLLEIGVWSSFVLPSRDPQPGSSLQISELLAMNNPVKAAWEIKKIMIDMAKDMLPTLMGNKFTEITISCLTCLDSDATNMFANEKDLYDEDGILVGIVFIEKVLARLSSLSI